MAGTGPAMTMSCNFARQRFGTTLHLVTTASLIWPASCAQATSSYFQRDLLADKSLQLRSLGIIAGHDLKCLRSGFEIAQPARRRQPMRFADELEGIDALALGAAAHCVELPGQDIAVL